MLSKALDMSKRTITDIFFWSTLLSNSSVKWSSADSVEWRFLFPLCRWCMTLFESRKLVNCEWAALSHTLDKLGSSDIGLVFAGSSLSPGLRIGRIFVFFRGSGKVLKVKELLIRLGIMGTITGELSFRILALTLSQPGALFEDRLLTILCASPVVMGWNANKGVLFGQELRSDSHGSNPCVMNVKIVFLGKLRGFQSCHCTFRRSGFSTVANGVLFFLGMYRLIIFQIELVLPFNFRISERTCSFSASLISRLTSWRKWRYAFQV